MSVELIVYVLVVYFLAGALKGVIGFGMPVVSLAMLAAVLGLTESIVVMLVPSLLTNIWQGLSGGQLIALIRRLWSMLVLSSVMIWLSTAILVSFDGGALVAGLGGILIFYAIFGLMAPQVPPPGRHEVWMTPIVGMLAGTSMGLTGTFVMPGTIYLQALGLGKDALVQSMGICFIVTTVVLGISLDGRGAMPMDLAILSVVVVVPAMIGMFAGKRYRDRLPEPLFRRFFFAVLLTAGVGLVVKTLFL